jgi:hypothetical protein
LLLPTSLTVRTNGLSTAVFPVLFLFSFCRGFGLQNTFTVLADVKRLVNFREVLSMKTSPVRSVVWL